MIFRSVRALHSFYSRIRSISRYGSGILTSVPAKSCKFFEFFSLARNFLALNRICELGRGGGSLLCFSLEKVENLGYGVSNFSGVWEGEEKSATPNAVEELEETCPAGFYGKNLGFGGVSQQNPYKLRVRPIENR